MQRHFFPIAPMDQLMYEIIKRHGHLFGDMAPLSFWTSSESSHLSQRAPDRVRCFCSPRSRSGGTSNTGVPKICFAGNCWI